MNQNQKAGDTEEDEEEENIEQEKPPTSNEAEKALLTLRKFVQAKGDSFQEQNAYERYVYRLLHDSKKQSTLDSFLEKC